MCISDRDSSHCILFISLITQIQVFFLVRWVKVAPSLQRKNQIVKVLDIIVVFVHLVNSAQAFGVVQVNEHFAASFWSGSII